MTELIYNGVKLTTLGVIVNAVSPPPCSQAEYEMITIPGREERLRSMKKTRPNIPITAELTITEPNRLRELYAVLQGYGKLILPSEPDKYYNAVPQVITPQNIVMYMHKMTVGFECEPFAYAVDNEIIIPELIGAVGGKACTVDVSGTYYSQPIYTILGNGDITLQVNQTDKPLIIYAVNGRVTVDCVSMMVHKDHKSVKNAGLLPFLNIGSNYLLLKGEVKGIEITKNERWL